MKSVLAVIIVCSVALALPARGQRAAIPGFFFTVDIDLARDGSGTLRLKYPQNPVASLESERLRFRSAVTEVQSVEMEDGFYLTTVTFRDVTRLSEAPELSSITAEREKLAAGQERIRAHLRSPVLFPLKSEEKLAITVNLPGPILGANTAESSGRTAVWRPAAQQYFTEDGITLEATYRPG